MLLSIVVPIYNGEKIIARCLDSLIAIKEKDVEFIIVDDGSKDHTNEICKKYEKIDARIHLVNQNNSGVSVARNLGVGLCKGKYIGFADADDELTRDYNEIIEVIKKVDSDFYAFEYYIQYEENIEKRKRIKFVQGKNDVGTLYNSFLSGTLSCVWNNIYKASIIKKNEIIFPDDMSMGEDTEFNARYIQCCKNAYYIEKVGYKYFCNNIGNATNARKISYLQDFVKIYDSFVKIRKFYGKSGFPFYCPYYINKVYEILKVNRKELKKEEKINFRQSGFYCELMKYRYKTWGAFLKKWLIRFYIYT